MTRNKAQTGNLKNVCYSCRVLLGLLLVVALFLAFLRFVVTPILPDYRPRIEAALSKQLNITVRIGALHVDWTGFNPSVILHDMRLGSAMETPFYLKEAYSELSWRSLLEATPVLEVLTLREPELHVRRDQTGQLIVAGIELQGGEDPRAINWILKQRHLRVQNGRLLWLDELRDAPPLWVSAVEATLSSHGEEHHLELSGRSRAAGALSVQGKLTGHPVAKPENWPVNLQVDWRQMDAATLKQWVDIPVVRAFEGDLRFRLEQASKKRTAFMQPYWRNLRAQIKGADLNLAQFNGRLEFTQHLETALQHGRLEFSGTGFKLLAPGVLSQPLKFDDINSALSWQASWLRNEQHESDPKAKTEARTHSSPAVSWPPSFSVQMQQLAVTNKDLKAELQGSYYRVDQKSGVVDLQARLPSLQLPALWRYLPKMAGQQGATWLRQALRSGEARHLQVQYKGPLDQFPDGNDNEHGDGGDNGGSGLALRGQAHIKNLTLAYAPDWPALNKLDGELTLEGRRVKFDVKQATIPGVKIIQGLAEIANVFQRKPTLTVNTKSVGGTDAFLRQLKSTPLKDKLGEFVRHLKATGPGTLDLALEIPLHRARDTEAKGSYQLADNRVWTQGDLPPLSHVSGKIAFNNHRVDLRDLRGIFLGAPVKARGSVGRNGAKIDFQGKLSLAETIRYYKLPLANVLDGVVRWRGEVQVKKRSGLALSIHSDLRGLDSRLPPPFAKHPSQRRPLTLWVTPRAGAYDEIRFKLGSSLGGRLIRQRRQGKIKIARGAIALGAPPKMPASGLHVDVVMSKALDVKSWQTLSRKIHDGMAAQTNGAQARPALSDYVHTRSNNQDLAPDIRLRFRAPSLLLQGLVFDDVKLELQPRGAWQWWASLKSKQAAGHVRWDSTGQGVLHAKLRRLLLKPAHPGEQDSVAKARRPATPEIVRTLPGLDVHIDNLAYDKRQLGSLRVLADNDKGFWRIQELRLGDEHTKLTAKGVWANTLDQNITQMELGLQSQDIGSFLDRVGFEDLVKGGKTDLQANLWWRGSPLALDFPSLSGLMHLSVEDGNFAQIDPGVGKLLGLLSLQALPRRLTFDYRDVFDRGFAFDNINGKFILKDGIMRSDGDLELYGPAAQVTMSGEVDLALETQNLRVHVEPELGTIAALGISLANPALGIATYAVTLIGSKMLKNPLNRMFRQKFQLTGSWNAPLVGKPGETGRALFEATDSRSKRQR